MRKRFRLLIHQLVAGYMGVGNLHAHRRVNRRISPVDIAHVDFRLRPICLYGEILFCLQRQLVAVFAQQTNRNILHRHAGSIIPDRPFRAERIRVSVAKHRNLRVSLPFRLRIADDAATVNGKRATKGIQIRADNRFRERQTVVFQSADADAETIVPVAVAALRREYAAHIAEPIGRFAILPLRVQHTRFKRILIGIIAVAIQQLNLCAGDIDFRIIHAIHP